MRAGLKCPPRLVGAGWYYGSKDRLHCRYGFHNTFYVKEALETLTHLERIRLVPYRYLHAVLVFAFCSLKFSEGLSILIQFGGKIV